MLNTIIGVIVIFLIFLIMHFIAKSLLNPLKNRLKSNVNLEHYLPKEELKNLRQVVYLMIILACMLLLVYSLELGGFFSIIELTIFNKDFSILPSFYGNNFNLPFTIFNIILSLYLSLNLHLKNNRKDQLIFISIVPFISICSLMHLLLQMVSIELYLIDSSIFLFFDIIHSLGYLYFMHIYYKKFMKYTKNNALGKTIIIFLALIVVTTLITVMTEGVNMLDAADMVTNAYVSNGYDVLGTTTIGKISEMAVSWEGYIISGVATATLTAAILTRHYDSELEKMEEENDRRIEKLKELINSNHEKK